MKKFIWILIFVLIIVSVKLFTISPLFGSIIEKQVFKATQCQLIADNYRISFLRNMDLSCSNGSVVTPSGKIVSFSDLNVSSLPQLLKGKIDRVEVLGLNAEVPEKLYLPNVVLDGDISLDGIVMADLLVEANNQITISSAIVYDGSFLAFEEAKINIYDGAINGEIRCENFSEISKLFRFNLVSKNLNLESLPWQLAPKEVTGFLDSSVEGEFVLNGTQFNPEKLNIAGDINLKNGIVDATEMLSGISYYLGNRVDLLTIRYETFSHHMSMRQGKYRFSDMKLEGPDSDWTGSGMISVANDVDMLLESKLPKGFTPELGDFSFMADMLRDEEGRITIPMQVEGVLPSPAVTLQLSQNKDMIQKNLEQGLQQLLDKWK